MTVALPFAVVLIAGFMTGMTGFGFSVLSVPLLVLVYQPHDVVVMALCLVPVTSLALLLSPQLRGALRPRLILPLTVLSIPGLPLGAVLFRYVDSSVLTILIGATLVVFSAFSLYSPTEWRLPRAAIFPSGVGGGLLATSTGLSGPAVAMFVHGQRLKHDEVVATMTAYVALVSLMGLGLMAVEGQITPHPLEQVAWLSPLAIVGVMAGRWWARRNHAVIDRYALQVLGLMGVWSILRGFMG